MVAFVQTSKNLNTQATKPKSAALLLNLNGKLVEQKRPIKLMDQVNKSITGNEEAVEIELSELLNAIEYAADDDDITALVLNLQQLESTSLSKLKEIGTAIKEFKKSNKPVVAIGDSYSQEQYYLASYADTVYLNPAGGVLITGFGRYQLYLKTALENLKITPHVFKVGRYKSAVEPFILDGMSTEARADAQRWLDKLWLSYVNDVAQERELSADKIAPNLVQFQDRFKGVQGNQAQYALQTGLVDELLTRPQLLETLQELVGKKEQGKSYAAISYFDYIRLIPSAYTQQPNNDLPQLDALAEQNIEQVAASTDSPELKLTAGSNDKIALITAAGTIMNGHQPAGTIGGDTLAEQLRETRFDKNVKAIVLRVDSPGGSAFASEIIRNEIQAIQKAGKPVIVSMGSYAASGGYWISADADKIFAASTTITGSIGIFGLFPTFENALTHYGISTDGVRTGPLAGVGLSQALPDHVAEAIQLSVESGYHQFINIVAKGRNMSPEKVDNIAQGRIWTGEEALEIGLVDEIGGIKEAIASAAELADLSDYSVQVVKERLSTQEQILMDLFGNSLASIKLEQTNPLRQIMGSVQNELELWSNFNDPQGRYALCPMCQ